MKEGVTLSHFNIPSLDNAGRERRVFPVYIAATLVHKDKQYMIRAMIDSGATGNFVDRAILEQLQIPTEVKECPELVHAVDGKPLSSGPITEHTVALTMICKSDSRKHCELIRFNIIDAPQYGFILGMPWLVLHDPMIEWEKKKVRFESVKCQDHYCMSIQTPELSLCAVYEIATAAETEVALPEIYSTYHDVFDKQQAEILPPHRIYDCQIDLMPGAILPCCRVYALSEIETQQLRDYLDHYVANGFIRPSQSPAASPLFFIPKANKELRACIDYRALNKYTVRNRYPLPLIPVLLDQVKRAQIYTRLDLRGAYHLVRMREGDEWKTAFKTQFGLYEYLVMPFGLCNAPAAFQFFLNDVLKEFLDIYVIVYIDDILIYSENEQIHTMHVSSVFEVLRKHRLFCKLSKCEFHVNRVEFLGVMLTPFGLSMAERKVKAVQDWPQPQKLKDIQCFLGFANFYRRFINQFSRIVAPITRLLRKNVVFEWSREADESFRFLKKAFTSAPVLTHPNPEEPFIVEADASEVAIGAILSQRDSRTGQLHPVAFMSRKLSDTEINYTIAEKELLAIRGAFMDWRHYLWGARYTVTVYTDHRNLQFMKSARQLTPRQLRWMQYFADFDFVVTYRPGKDNGKADALTRQQSDYTGPMKVSNSIISPDRVICSIAADTFLDKVRTCFSLPQWTQWVSGNPERKIRAGLPFHGSGVFLPTKQLQRQAMHWCHTDMVSGHPGLEKTIELITRRFWWPTLRRDVRSWVGECEVCARAKNEHTRAKGLLLPLPTPTGPWKHISLDFIVGLPKDQGHSAILVVIDSLTKLAHFIPCRNLPTAGQLAQILLTQVVRLHGLPEVILSDRGPQFTARFWQVWCKALGIASNTSTSFHPQTDGQTERLNQTLKQFLRCYAHKAADSWVALLWLAELAYNNLTHKSTGTSPFMATFGYHPRTLPVIVPSVVAAVPDVQDHIRKLQAMSSQVIRHLDAAKKEYKRYADRKRMVGPQYVPGNMVWLSTRNIRFKKKSIFHPKFIGPFAVVRRVNPVAYKLALPSSLGIHPVFHTSLLKRAPNVRCRKPPPVLRDCQVEYEVQRILDSRRVGSRLWYLVSWKGYGAENDSWEPLQNLHAPRLLASFHRRFPGKPGPVRQ